MPEFHPSFEFRRGKLQILAIQLRGIATKGNPMHGRLFCLVVTCFIATSSWPVLAEDWPQWRGPNRDGVWQVEGVLDELPQGQLDLEWSVEIGPGYNGPTVAEGRVYVMDRQTENGETERILCLNSKTGELVWKHEYPVNYRIGYKAGPRASVTIHDGRAYAVGAMGHFHCLDAAKGNVLWQRDLNEEYAIEMPIWGIAASPLIYQDLVIQQVAGSDGATMVGFRTEDGQEAWRSLSERAGYASPVLIQQGERDVLVCWTGESLSGLNPKSGKVLWAHRMEPIKMPIGIATPAVHKDLIFVSSFYDGSLLVRRNDESVSTELVWRARGQSERNTGTDRTETPGGVNLSEADVFGVHAMIGTPIVKDGFIYAVDSYGEFRCLEAKTGKRVWEDTTAVPRNRWATIHMVEQGERVWMFNEAGELMIAQLSPEGLKILSRAQLIEPTRVQLARREGVCWSHPAYAEKSVFARNDNRIVRASLAK
ncbi:MAG: PQQ-binding-like beta-propeller repeat protein [Planctomycetota bacterium]